MNARNIRTVMVVGSWAKEQITVEHLKRTSDVDVAVFMDTHNPALAELADTFQVGSFKDVGAIADFATDQGCELALITTASPLAGGLADLLEERGVVAFGPRRAAARLESDKAFARQLVSQCCPAAVPRFEVFDLPGPAQEFAETLDWRVAVKPIGLTDGLGVRVWGDQLHSQREVREYIEEVCARRIGGSASVIIEECLEGEEFTIQALVHDRLLTPTPAVQDFKKLLPGGKGPNTASMGSYSVAGSTLPFMNSWHYQEALQVMERTLVAAAETTGIPCTGFLYGQFMVTADGVKLIEYNFRPGDPEWMNTITVLRTPLLEAVVSLLNGEPVSLDFEPLATVCKYIVPEGYPERLGQVLEVELDREQLRATGVDVYHSCGLDGEGRLNVGSERGLAFLAKHETVAGAEQALERAIQTVSGSFFHRTDVASAELIATKVDHVAQLRRDGILFRPAREDEFLDIQGLAAGCPPLEAYPQHVYRILLRHFGNCSFVAERAGRVVGFVLGLASSRQEGTYFLWQIGVAPDQQGTGLGRRLLDHVEAEIGRLGLNRVDVTIDPMNEPSRKLFERCGYRNVSWREGAVVEVNRQATARDFYRPGRHFMVFEKLLG